MTPGPVRQAEQTPRFRRGRSNGPVSNGVCGQAGRTEACTAPHTSGEPGPRAWGSAPCRPVSVVIRQKGTGPGVPAWQELRRWGCPVPVPTLGVGCSPIGRQGDSGAALEPVLCVRVGRSCHRPQDLESLWLPAWHTVTTAHLRGLIPRSVGVRVTGTFSFNMESVPCPEVSVTCKHRRVTPLVASAASRYRWKRPPGVVVPGPPRTGLVSPCLASDFPSGQSSATATSPGPLPSCGHVGCWSLEELRVQSGTQQTGPGRECSGEQAGRQPLCVGQASACICAGRVLAEWFQAGASALRVSSGSSGRLCDGQSDTVCRGLVRNQTEGPRSFWHRGGPWYPARCRCRRGLNQSTDRAGGQRGPPRGGDWWQHWVTLSQRDLTPHPAPAQSEGLSHCPPGEGQRHSRWPVACAGQDVGSGSLLLERRVTDSHCPIPPGRRTSGRPTRS